MSDLSRCDGCRTAPARNTVSNEPRRIAHKSLCRKAHVSSKRVDTRPAQVGRVPSIQTTCREKGGAQTAFLEDIGHSAIMDLYNAFTGECLCDLAGVQVRVLELVFNDAVFVFLTEPLGVGMDRM